ncbi:MAG: hypothetical protein ACU837_10110 [Gammaproteobacteria bacterium]
MLAKIAAIIVLVWFYRTAAKIGEKAIQWAVIGVIGFFLAAFITHFGIVDPVSKFVLGQKEPAGLITQLPAFAGLAAAYFIRKKYLLKKSDISTPPAE